jgi:hypothetical protein
LGAGTVLETRRRRECRRWSRGGRRLRGKAWQGSPEKGGRRGKTRVSPSLPFPGRACSGQAALPGPRNTSPYLDRGRAARQRGGSGLQSRGSFPAHPSPSFRASMTAGARSTPGHESRAWERASCLSPAPNGRRKEREEESHNEWRAVKGGAVHAVPVTLATFRHSPCRRRAHPCVCDAEKAPLFLLKQGR